MITKSDYLLHSQITEKTFRQFRFRRFIPKQTYTFYVHRNLRDSSPQRVEACLLGICEVLSGCQDPHVRAIADATGETRRLAEGMDIEIPPDTGIGGICHIAIDHHEKAVYLGSIVSGEHVVHFKFIPSEIAPRRPVQ